MSKGKRGLGLLAVLSMLGLAIGSTRNQWLPLLTRPTVSVAADPSATDDHAHAEAAKGLVLSDSAKASLGLELSPIVLQEYWRSLPVPGEVMEEPGHCEQGVSATVHGIILRIHAFHGQTVRVGDALFDLRPTSELLATSQTALLKSIQEMDLATAELKRITPLAEMIASKGLKFQQARTDITSPMNPQRPGRPKPAKKITAANPE